MSKSSQLSKLNTATFFNKKMVAEIIGGNSNSISTNISRWLSQNILIQLKKGLYTTREYYKTCQDKTSYLEFIANIIKSPSYLSNEYVLQKYGILSESVFSLTSITTKKTMVYNNNLGMFIYSNIKDELFTGYIINNKYGYQIREATKSKALFDYLYFKLIKVPKINQEVINSLRLNLNEFNPDDYSKLQEFIQISKLNKFNNLIKILKKSQ